MERLHRKHLSDQQKKYCGGMRKECWEIRFCLNCSKDQNAPQTSELQSNVLQKKRSRRRKREQ